MNDTTASYRRRKTTAGVTLFLSLLLALVAVLVGAQHFRERWQGEATHLALAILVIVVLAFVIVMAIRTLLDKKPKLVIDEEGIKEHNPPWAPHSIHSIPWEKIESLDAELTTVDGMVSRGCVNLSVVMENGDLGEVKVHVTGLDASPHQVIQLIKRAWTQFNYRRRTGFRAPQ